MLIIVGLRVSAALAQQTAQTESSGVKFPTCSLSSIEREWLANFYLALECARDGGQFAGWELTGAAGLSEDESHGQAPHP
jgi:hypothetical protein